LALILLAEILVADCNGVEPPTSGVLVASGALGIWVTGSSGSATGADCNCAAAVNTMASGLVVLAEAALITATPATELATNTPAAAPTMAMMLLRSMFVALLRFVSTFFLYY
jgi:hypothetical protein